MGYKFYTADVFTNEMFGGNQLALFPQALGLTPEQMQKIAKEFNLSETVFVFSAHNEKHCRHLRIFTPTSELPFAGHPTVGTAYILAAIGEIILTEKEIEIIFEEGIGPIPVKIRAQAGKPIYSELKAGQSPQLGLEPPSIPQLATMLSLDISDFKGGDYQPQALSCGLPFLFIPLKNRHSVAKAKLNLQIWQEILQNYSANNVYIFSYDGEIEGSLRSRMFAPGLGILEDPATGSAATALAGYLAPRQAQKDGTLRWVIEQGFEIGRPSIINLECDLTAGKITEIRVGGASVLVSEGVLYLE